MKVKFLVKNASSSNFKKKSKKKRKKSVKTNGTLPPTTSTKIKSAKPTTASNKNLP